MKFNEEDWENELVPEKSILSKKEANELKVFVKKLRKELNYYLIQQSSK